MENKSLLSGDADLDGIIRESLDVLDDIRAHESIVGLYDKPDDVNAMVKILAVNTIELQRRERKEHALKEMAMNNRLRAARSNEAEYRRRLLAVERAVREHPDGYAILKRADEIIDPWVEFDDFDLPF